MTTQTTFTAVQSILAVEERRALRQTWSAYHALREAQAEDFILYAVLRGTNPMAGFTPISNTCKLANGFIADQGYRQALQMLCSLSSARLTNKLKALLPEALAERLAELASAATQAASALRSGKKGA